MEPARHGSKGSMDNSNHSMRSLADDTSNSLRSSTLLDCDESTTSEGGVSSSYFPGIAKSETRNLGYIKITLVLVLVVATCSISLVMFFTTKTVEANEFEVQFQDLATRLLQEFSLMFLGSLGAVDNFGVTITSHVRSMNLAWPYAFVPEFDIRAASTNSLARSRFLTLSPVVYNHELAEFENYTVDLSFWVDQALARKHGHAVPPSPIVHNHHGHRELEELGMAGMGEQPGVTENTGIPGNHANDLNGSMDGDMEGQHGDGMDPGHTESSNSEDGHGGHTGNGGQGMGEYHEYPDIRPNIFRIEDGSMVAEMDSTGMYLPIFECEPVTPEIVNFNLLSHEDFGNELLASLNTREIVVGKMVIEEGEQHHHHQGGHHVYDPLTEFIFAQGEMNVGPFSQIVFPIFSSFGRNENTTSAGFISIFLFWGEILANNLPDTAEGVVCVVENACGQQVSYEVTSGGQATFLGEGDFHDTTFDHLEETITFAEIFGAETETALIYSGVLLNTEFCPYSVRVYPSKEMEEKYLTRKPVLYLLLVIGVFLITSLTIIGHDKLHEKRNKAVLESARRTNLIVSSMFPPIVRDRIFKDRKKELLKAGYLATPRKRLKNYFREGDIKGMDGAKPISDLFLHTTIMFADIVGFTAWSSLREPGQVFTLLETLFGHFDKMAKVRVVFKVESIGDCYVCAAGLPTPQDDHAPRLVRFAHDCLSKFSQLTRSLQASLGPDTADLDLRVGIHSGPVTAGVLRGEKSRFQLFGDTMNTANRMESTSLPGQIQCSRKTAELLIEAGYREWLKPREEAVEVKGKGEIGTYWALSPFRDDVSGVSEGEPSDIDSTSELSLKPHMWGGDLKEKGAHMSQQQSLIDWQVGLLSRQLKLILAHRSRRDRMKGGTSRFEQSLKDSTEPTPLSQMSEIIELPEFDVKRAMMVVNPESIELPESVTSQLSDYITALSCIYRANPFHSFYHATHVTMAANKLLHRAASPDNVAAELRGSAKTLALELHQSTYGLTSDPMTQFAILFSALIHDVDHMGVSNAQLVKENTEDAVKYSGKSVAEQNSIDLAWDMLMEPSLEELRGCIYSNEAEFRRFRQLVVNMVIATDIFDKDLKELRNKRWSKAFHNNIGEGDFEPSSPPHMDFDRKATIVMEHIIQAADVSHTMQHWHVYQKWNEKLFREMYLAYEAGRGGDKDPSEFWYKGELWFFDNYVIPLAHKLKECGVFGVSSAECLNYAMQNREEWEKKGEDVVRRFKDKYCERSVSNRSME